MGRRLFHLLPSPLAQAVALLVLLLRRARSDRAGLVLLYHRIAATAGSSDRDLNPAVAAPAFAAELRWLRRFYRVVPARDILAAAAHRRRWEPYPTAVTFDDDWAGHVRWALPALRAAGVRATFFVSGGPPAVRWWDRLQAAHDTGLPLGRVVEGEGLHAMARTLERCPPARRRAADAALRELGAEPPAAGLTEAELLELASEHDIGFHTMAHDALPTLPEAELGAALEDGRERLQAVCERPIDLFAYPHGVAGEREVAAARAAGYRLAFTSVAAAVGPGTDPLRIGRAEPGPVPLGRFALAVERALGRRA